MKKKVFLFLLLLMLLFGCKNDDTVKLGGFFSLTGVAADYGKKTNEGFQLAIDLINQNGGIHGKKVVGIIEDTKSSPKDAIVAYRKLKDIDGLHFFIGDVYSNTTQAVIQQKDADVIIFAPGASKPDLVNLSPNFVRNWSSDDFDGLAMARIIKERNVKNIALISQVSDYTQALSNAFKNEFENLGGNIVIEQSFQETQNDFSAMLLKFKNQNIEYVYLTALSKQMGYILKQAAQINYYPQWFTNLTVNTDDCKNIAGEARNGVIFSTPYVDFENLNEQGKAFKAIYIKKYGKEPDATVAHSFDAVNILTMVLKKEENLTDFKKIIDDINKVKDYPGVSGKTTFDGHGSVLKDVEVMQIKNDSIISLKIFKF
jgi:branched-chain amino acid transport system substrate-binding protein